jgi:acyl carrier protein
MDVSNTTREQRQRCLKALNKVKPELLATDSISAKGLDDLDMMRIIMEIEDEFGTRVKEGKTKMIDFNTVNDLINWLLSFT